MNSKRFKETLEILNEYTEPGEGVNRLAYSNAEQQAIKFLIEEFEKEGLSIREDAAGNIIARKPGENDNLPVVAFGSHIDTVYEGGQFDGSIGVIAALETIRYLNENDITTKAPVEVIIFACEESSRFGFSTVGSKAMSGRLNTAQLSQLQDKDGVSFAKAIAERNLNINHFNQAKRTKNDLAAFVELHIEQGPRLENESKEIGIVTSIAAPVRYQLTVKGEASHSGTTPMNYRKDAFSGAAEIALELEKMTLSEARHGTVATIGECTVSPGAINVIPGIVEMKVDIRGTSVESIKRVRDKFSEIIEEVQRKRMLGIEVNLISEETPVDMNKNIINRLEKQCEMNTIKYIKMPSGAGHDAMNMANICPTAMIFVPSENGLSHNPKEYTSIGNIMNGVVLLKDIIIDLADNINEKGEKENAEQQFKSAL